MEKKYSWTLNLTRNSRKLMDKLHIKRHDVWEIPKKFKGVKSMVSTEMLPRTEKADIAYVVGDERIT